MARAFFFVSILLMAGCSGESPPRGTAPPAPSTAPHHALERAQNVERQATERHRRQLDTADRASE